MLSSCIVLGHYPFAGNADDISGHGNNGVIKGPTLTEGVKKLPNAYLFQNRNDHIEMNLEGVESPWGDGFSEISVSVWAKNGRFMNNYPHILTLTGKKYRIFRCHGMGSVYGSKSGRIAFFFCNRKRRIDLISKTNTYRDQYGTWNHFVCTYNSNEAKAKLYVNGKLEGIVDLEEDGPIDDILSSLCLGHATSADSSWKGSIGEIMIFANSLTVEQVKDIYLQKGKTVIDYQNTIHDKEFYERIDTLKNHSDISFPLSNKTLYLWKPLFVNSSKIKKNLNEISECDLLGHLSLDLEESIIVQLLLEKHLFSVDSITLSNFIDYYLFFHLLGMKRGIIRLFSYFPRMKLSASEIFHLFSTFAIDYESEEISLLFQSSDSEEVKEFPSFPHFKTSLCLFLITELKQRENEFKFLQSSKNGYLSILSLLSLENTIKVTEHEELMNNENEKSILELLFSDQEDQILKKDVSLITTDSERIECHLFVLLLQSSFFHSMIRFSGSETEDLITKREIKLHQIKKSQLEVMKRYYYLKNVKTEIEPLKKIIEDKLDVLLICLIHSDMYFENDFLNSLLKRLSVVISNKNKTEEIKEELESSIRKHGHFLERNEKLQKKFLDYVIGNDGGVLNEKMIKKWIKHSYQDFMFEKLEKENYELKKEMEVMKETFEERIKRLEDVIIQIQQNQQIQKKRE